jgi:hypothetical protein
MEEKVEKLLFANNESKKWEMMVLEGVSKTS